MESCVARLRARLDGWLWLRLEFHVPSTGIDFRVDVNLLTRRTFWEVTMPEYILETEHQRRPSELCELRLN